MPQPPSKTVEPPSADSAAVGISELLACPFCGCTRIEVSANRKDDRDGHVWCDNDECDASMYGSTRQEAIERWNLRQAND